MRRSAPAGLAAAVVALSISAIFVQEARTDAATVVWLRMALAVPMLAPFVVRERRVAPATTRDIGLALLAGAILAAHFLTWTASLAYTSVAASVLLVSVHPLIVTPVGAWLYHDAFDARAAGGIVLAVAGTVITCVGSLGGGSDALRGDLLALAGAVALAAYLLIGRGRGRGGIAAYSATAYTVVSVAALVTAVAGGTLHTPSGRTLLACLGLAVFCTIGGHTVLNWALRRLPAATVSLSLLAETPIAAALAFVILGQVPATAVLVGGVLVLAGLALTMSGAGGRTRPVPVATID